MDPIAKFKQLVLRNDAAGLRQLFLDYPEAKAGVDEPLFAFDSPAIVFLAGRGDREVMDALLEAGADINVRSSWWAGSFGVLDHSNHELAAYLIERGATLDAHAASRHGFLKELRTMIDADPGQVHARGGDGQMPLHVARTPEIAEFLLDRGADIDARDIDHESTAAQYLIATNPEVVRFLMDRGCSTDILMAAAIGDVALVRRYLDSDPESIRTRVDSVHFPMRDPRAGGTIYIWTLGQSRSPHQVARRFHHEDVLELLLERTPDHLKLAQACLTGHPASIDAMLARDAAQVRALAAENPQYISDAAQDNDTAAVRLMLKCGWPLAGGGKETPLHWAAWHGNTEMLGEILAFHPPLEAKDETYHATPLGWAIHGSENGPNSKTGDYGGTTEALLAAGARRPEKVEGSAAVRKALGGRTSKA